MNDNKYWVLETLTKMNEITEENQSRYVDLTLVHLEQFYMDAMIPSVKNDFEYMYRVKEFHLEEIQDLITKVSKIKNYSVDNLLKVMHSENECKEELRSLFLKKENIKKTVG